MGSSIRKAIELILSADPELLNILSTTARVCLTSSILALLIGVPLGILLGAERFPGRRVLLVLNRTLIGMPPVVCGLLFYMLFSGVGPFRHLHWLFTVKLMILAQVVLITPIIVGVMETFVADTAPALRETARGLGFGRMKEYRLLINECLYSIFSSYLLSFARAIAEVGAVAMVGGAIAWKTNVMTTAIMMYTNRGSFTLGIALGLILLTLSLLVNIILSVMQGRQRDAGEAEPMKTTAFSKTYNGRTVLTLPALELPPGQITAVIGPNGSGKSTFAKILAGIERADDKKPILSGISVGYLPQKSFPFRMSTESCADESAGHRSPRRTEREKTLRRRDSPYGTLPHPDAPL